MAIPLVLLGSPLTVCINGPAGIKPFISSCMDFISQFTPHRFNGTWWLWSSYASISREAGINSDALAASTSRVLEKLNKKDVALADSSADDLSQPADDPQLQQALTRYTKTVESRWFRTWLPRTASARQWQVKRLSEIAYNTPHNQIEEKIKPLFEQLPQNSELRREIKTAEFFSSANQQLRTDVSSAPCPHPISTFS